MNGRADGPCGERAAGQRDILGGQQRRQRQRQARQTGPAAMKRRSNRRFVISGGVDRKLAGQARRVGPQGLHQGEQGGNRGQPGETRQARCRADRREGRPE